jgi:hypothetical protein
LMRQALKNSISQKIWKDHLLVRHELQNFLVRALWENMVLNLLVFV